MTEADAKLQFLRDAFPNIEEDTLRILVESPDYRDLSLEALVEQLASIESSNSIPESTVNDLVNDKASESDRSSQLLPLGMVSSVPAFWDSFSPAAAVIDVDDPDSCLAYELQAQELHLAAANSPSAPTPSPSLAQQPTLNGRPLPPPTAPLPSTSRPASRSSSSKARSAGSSNQLLNSLHQERLLRNSGSSDSAHDSAQNHNPSTSASQAQPQPSPPSGSVGRSRTAASAPLTVRQQLQQVRNSQNTQWRNQRRAETPTVTLQHLQQQEQSKSSLLSRIKAGVWPGRDPQSSGAGGAVPVHTISNTFYDPQRIGREALEYTNQYRRAKGRGALEWSDTLYQIGCQHSADMGSKKVPFGHDGFKQRCNRIPFHYRAVAENVAFNSGTINVARVAVDGWIKSPGHEKNLVGDFNVCGIGVAQGLDGSWYLTQLFAFAN